MAEKTIGAASYRVAKLPAIDGLKLLARVGKLVGPALPMIRGMLVDPENRGASELAAVASIIQSTSEDQFVSFVVEVAEIAQIKQNGGYEAVIFNHHFNDDLLGAFQLVMFVLEVQFGDFFGGGGKSMSGAGTLRRPRAAS